MMPLAPRWGDERTIRRGLLASAQGGFLRRLGMAQTLNERPEEGWVSLAIRSQGGLRYLPRLPISQQCRL